MENQTSAIGHINFNAKLSSERSAANPQAAFEAAGDGNRIKI